MTKAKSKPVAKAKSMTDGDSWGSGDNSNGSSDGVSVNESVTDVGGGMVTENSWGSDGNCGGSIGDWSYWSDSNSWSSVGNDSCNNEIMKFSYIKFTN